MNQSEIEEIAKEIYSLVNDKDFWKPFFPEPHAIASKRIAIWHLEKVSQLQSRIAELKARVNELETFIR